jgi:catecholate siderophore receptor
LSELLGHPLAAEFSVRRGTGCSTCPPITTIDLFNPVETAIPMPNKPNPTHQVFTLQNAHGVYAQEFYEPLPWLKALVGARYDSWERHVRQETFKPNTRDVAEAGPITTTTVSAPTFRYGVILEPITGYTLYASQSNSFRPTIVTNSWDGKLDWRPETGEMLEIGQKMDMLVGRLSVGMAYFDIMKYNVLVNLGPHVSGNGNIFEQAGTQRSQGFELDGTFRSADENWSLTGAYAYMYSSYYTFYSNTSDFSGKRTTWSPINTFSLWAGRRLPGGFGVNLGFRYMDEVFPANDNVVALPSYWLANASLAYQNGGSEFRVNVDNLLDRQDHFTSGGNTSLNPGAPRVITTSFNQKF